MEIPHTFIIKKDFERNDRENRSRSMYQKSWKADDVHKTATAVRKYKER
jgi:hypothetical protein